MAPTLGRASSVCNACRNRKRMCDKRLPACSYCSNKGFICVYTDRTAAKKHHFNRNQPGFNLTSLQPSQLHQPCFNAAGEAEVVHGGALDCLKSIEISPNDITTAYFDGFHQWLPVVDLATFNRAFNDTPREAPMAHNLLLSAMKLILLPDLILQSNTKTIDRHDIYLQTKLLFARAQITTPRSMLVIAAGLLISAFEYVCKDVEAASVTITTSKGLLRLLHSFEGEALYKRMCCSYDVLHTIICCELFQMHQIRPVLNYADLDVSSACLEDDIEAMTQQSKQDDPGGFMGLIQAAKVLHKVLWLVNRSFNSLVKTDAISQLDTELTSFLDHAMTETVSGGVRAVGAISVLIRAIFLLQESCSTGLLDQDERYRTKRAATLDCVAQLMVDVARTNVHASAPIRLSRHPYTGVYNIRAAIRYLTSKSDMNGSDEAIRSALTDLHALDDVYAAHWRALGMAL